MKVRAWSLGFVFLFAAQAQCQEMTVLSVNQCVESALKKNALVGISQEHIHQAQARITQARGEMLPVLSTDVYGAASTDHPVLVWNTMVKQPLFFGGESMARKERADMDLAISREEKILTEIELSYLVRKTFFETKKTEAEVELCREELAYLKTLLFADKQLYRANYLTQEKVLEREAIVGSKEKELWNREKNLEHLYANLLQLTGLDTNKAYVLEDMTEAKDTGNMPSRGVKNHPFMSILDLQISQLQKDLDIAKSALFPKVHLVSKYRKEQDSFYEKDALEAGVLAHWNIWDFGITAGKIQESKSKLAEGVLLKDSRWQEYQLALKKAWDLLLVQRKVVSSNKQMVAATEERFKNMKVRHMHGDAPNQSSHETRLRLANARVELIKSVYDYYINEAEMLKLLGLVNGAGRHE